MTAFLGTIVEVGETVPRSAEIVVGSDALITTREDGYPFEIALRDLRLESGGFEGDVVFCRPADGRFTVAVSAPGFVAALAAAGAPPEELAKLRRQARKRHVGRWVGVGVVLAVLVAVVVLVWQVPTILAASVDALPPDIDRELGDAAFDGMDLGGPVLEAPAAQAFVDGVIARLEPHAALSGLDFRAVIVRSDDVNAFALPGGRMVVLSGLVAAAAGPDEVAGVMAHEMAHVTLRHGLRNVAVNAGLLLAVQLLLGDASVWVQLAGDAAVVAGSNAYSRDQEAAADEEGARMLAAAGLDPEGMVAFFERLASIPGTDLSGPMTWLSTHPAHGERIAAIRELAPALPRGRARPLDVDWDTVRASVE